MKFHVGWGERGSGPRFYVPYYLYNNSDALVHDTHESHDKHSTSPILSLPVFLHHLNSSQAIPVEGAGKVKASVVMKAR
jgi:hypothetical protein